MLGKKPSSRAEGVVIKAMPDKGVGTVSAVACSEGWIQAKIFKGTWIASTSSQRQIVVFVVITSTDCASRFFIIYYLYKE